MIDNYGRQPRVQEYLGSMVGRHMASSEDFDVHWIWMQIATRAAGKLGKFGFMSHHRMCDTVLCADLGSGQYVYNQI